MKLEVAQRWYDTRSVGDEVTLIIESHVHPDLRCNIWHVKGRDRDLLIDSGLGLLPLRAAIGAQTARTTLAVASHTHFDHVGGHHEFAHRLCHPLEADVLTAPNADNTVLTAFRSMVNMEETLSALPYAGFRFDRYRVAPAPPTQLIEEGDEIDLGNRLFRVFHMPGHSPGSICLFEAATATLFAGDVLYDGKLLDTLYHSNPDVYLETLARLREIPARVFHCGHFGSFGRERMFELIDAYRAARS